MAVEQGGVYYMLSCLLCHRTSLYLISSGELSELIVFYNKQEVIENNAHTLFQNLKKLKDTDWIIDKMHFARPSKLQVAYGRRSQTTLLCLGMTKGILPSYQTNRRISTETFYVKFHI